MIKKAYVIGNNTSKSLSPTIFKYWLKKNKIEGAYLYKEVEPSRFEESINEILNEKDVCGFNVTTPFKEKIIKYLDVIDEHSKEIGAVNFVTKKKEGWIGKNTDWCGFSKSIKNNIKIKNKNNVVVLGYGGAAKAIIYALKKEGYKTIKVFNRTREKIKHLRGEEGIFALELSQVHQHVNEADLIVNTIPKNIFSFTTKTQPALKKPYGCDIVYAPKITDFLLNFNSNKRIHGFLMLVYQAAPCFEEWFGETPTIDDELFSLLENKQQK